MLILFCKVYQRMVQISFLDDRKKAFGSEDSSCDESRLRVPYCDVWAMQITLDACEMRRR